MPSSPPETFLKDPQRATSELTPEGYPQEIVDQITQETRGKIEELKKKCGIPNPSRAARQYFLKKAVLKLQTITGQRVPDNKIPKAFQDAVNLQQVPKEGNWYGYETGPLGITS